MKLNARAQRANPVIMTGIESSKIRRRPIRSIRLNATTVSKKLVKAMDKEAKVGASKPTRANMVAEKYIKEFLRSPESVKRAI